MWINRIRKKVVGFFTGGAKAKSKPQTKKLAKKAAKKAATRKMKAAALPSSPPKRKKRITGRRGNDIQLENRESLQGTISIDPGRRNVVKFGTGSKFTGSIRISGNGNHVEFGPHTRIKGRIIIKGHNQNVTFGAHTTAVEILIICAEGKDVTIGKWCMLSQKIVFRTTDAHSVLDRNTVQRVNKAKSVKIGDHVWIGGGALIGKGAVVPSDSIVGAMSFVNGSFDEEGIVLGGTPARIVKRGITWHRSRRDHFTRDELDAWKIEDPVEPTAPVESRECPELDIAADNIKRAGYVPARNQTIDEHL